KLIDYTEKTLAYDNLPAATSDDDRFQALRAAEMVISTQPEPSPANPAALRALLDTKKNAFETRRNLFAAVLTLSAVRFTDFFNAVAALLPVSAFDPQPFDITPLGDRAVLLAQDLVINLRGHRTAIDARRETITRELAAHDLAGSATARVEALQKA